MSAHSTNFKLAQAPVVSVQNLTVYRGQYAAVQNVSFDLYPGTSTAIVGPNGSGKSTLVQAMLGLIPHTTGTVDIFGCPIARLHRLRQQIGYMPQNFIFDRGFPISVGELVGLGWGRGGREMMGREEEGEEGTRRRGDGESYEVPVKSFELAASTQNSKLKTQNSKLTSLFPWQPNPEKVKAINYALQRVNAFHLKRQAIGTLSGGELKRVLLAYCLVAPRRLLVLDEAFAEVDAQGEVEFYHLLRSLMQEEGWTLLQISHDLDMVSRTCDHVLCLNRSLICAGTPEFALSPHNLQETYGPGFGRYYHQH